MNPSRMRVATLVGVAALAFSGATMPAHAAVPVSARHAECRTPDATADGARGAGPGHQRLDHREVSAKEQRAIERRTRRILARKGVSKRPGEEVVVPLYVHVMRDDAGRGDVSDKQIAEQVRVLNETFAGEESRLAADTGFRFVLKDVTRYNNTTWHYDRASNHYRSLTREGGADALNMWVVEFDYLGIATFPWDYARHGEIDGIRVHYESLPGGAFGSEYSLGKTATHEVGHWLGVYHTFQGGCTETNDEVADTPAQSSPSSGCPVGRDSCELPGSDPIHNYMDYSFDSCYDRFTEGQSERMSGMWSAYRS